jgi:hypothetical protein
MRDGGSMGGVVTCAAHTPHTNDLPPFLPSGRPPSRKFAGRCPLGYPSFDQAFDEHCQLPTVVGPRYCVLEIHTLNVVPSLGKAILPNTKHGTFSMASYYPE